jgi:HAD superfamily hydrolase (TIGR01509 family)
MPDAVIFDLDGVILDSEQLWNEVKREVAEANGGRWREEAPRAMMGMSSAEWSVYMRDELGLPMEAEAINAAVVAGMHASLAEHLPLLPGAREAVLAAAERWPLALASSSNREVIDRVLELAGLAGAFRVTVSSEEVARGKPSPDVYLAAAAALGAEPYRCVAIEDSANGIRSAAAAGMAIVAIPNPHYPPSADALALASITVASTAAADPAAIERAANSKRSLSGEDRPASG